MLSHVGRLSMATVTLAVSVAAGSAAPFSEYKSVNCDGAASCSFNFAAVPSGKRLEIHNVSCVDAMTSGPPDVAFLGLYILQGAATKALHSLHAEWQGTSGSTQWWVANHTLLAHVKAGQKPNITITVDAVPTVQQLSCTISGVLL